MCVTLTRTHWPSKTLSFSLSLAPSAHKSSEISSCIMFSHPLRYFFDAGGDFIHPAASTTLRSICSARRNCGPCKADAMQFCDALSLPLWPSPYCGVRCSRCGIRDSN